MNKLTKGQLASLIASYLKANKIAIEGFEASKDNCLGLLDKIGKTIEIDGVLESSLEWMDGENLPAGKTIEEYFLDFIPPMDYEKNPADKFSADEIGARPVKYSYTQGRKKWQIKRYFNDLERAFSTSEGAVNAMAEIVTRLDESYRMWRDDVKKQLLGTLATKAKTLMNPSKTYATKTAYAVGESVKKDSAGSEIAIVFLPITASNALAYADAVAQGYLAPIHLVETIDVPTDTATGEAFIKAVKEASRKMQFKNHENLNGALIKPTPKAVRRLVVDTTIMPSLEVDTLAGAFHQENLAFPTTLSEVDGFGDNKDVFAILLDERGVRIHNSYNATRENTIAKEDSELYVKHTEDTAFISANTFVHVFLKK